MQTPVLGGPTGLPPEDQSPAHLVLSPASPNPFRSRTTIAFKLPTTMATELRILDVAGRIIRSVEMGSLPAGPHTFEWDGTDAAGRSMASGLYFIRLEAGRVVRSTALLRLR